jgi:hypothetical protein
MILALGYRHSHERLPEAGHIYPPSLGAVDQSKDVGRLDEVATLPIMLAVAELRGDRIVRLYTRGDQFGDAQNVRETIALPNFQTHVG